MKALSLGIISVVLLSAAILIVLVFSGISRSGRLV